MGNHLFSDEDLSESFQQSYSFQEQPYLLHRSTGQPYTLYKLTTNSHEQTANSLANVQSYKDSKCGSISVLKEHYYKSSKSYCSDRETIYFLFYDHGRNNMKEEYLERRYKLDRFSHREIETVMHAMLCGIRQYHTIFQRGHSPLILEAVCIQPQTHRLYVRDPWLVPQTSSSSFHHFVLTYPPSQKLRSLYQDKNSLYDQYYSDLFSTGMYGLQLYNMEFMDGVYDLKNKHLNFEELNIAIANVTDPQLQNGFRTLLQERPARRTDIFNEWNINCQGEKKLERICKEVNDYSMVTQEQTVTNNNKKFFLDPYGHQTHIDVSPPKDQNFQFEGRNQTWVQPFDVRTPVPINSSQFNSTFNNSPLRHNQASNQISTGNFSSHPSGRNMIGNPVRNNGFLAVPSQIVNNGHSYNTKSTSNLAHSQRTNSSRSGSPYQTNSPINHHQTFQQVNKVIFGNKLLSIQRPGKSQDTGNIVISQGANFQRGNQGIVQEIQSFKQPSPYLNPGIFQKSNQKAFEERQQPVAYSLNSLKVRFGQPPQTTKNLFSSIDSTQRTTNFSASSGIVNRNLHSSSLDSKSQNTSSINVVPNILSSRPRSISNKPNIGSSLPSQSGYSFNRNPVTWNSTSSSHNPSTLNIEPALTDNQKSWNPFSDSLQKGFDANYRYGGKDQKTFTNASALLNFNKEDYHETNNTNTFPENNGYLNPVNKAGSQNDNLYTTGKLGTGSTQPYQIKPDKFADLSTSGHQFARNANNSLEQNKSPIQSWKNPDDPLAKKSNSPNRASQPEYLSIQQIPNQSSNMKENLMEKAENGQTSEQIYSELKNLSQNLRGIKQQLTDEQLDVVPGDRAIPNNSQETTPTRRTGRDKYNSTIVEVNEETPSASDSSNQGDVEYVVEEYETGSRYEGEKVNNMRSGRGKFYYQDGGHYEGEWKKNKMHGWGKLYYEGGRLAYQGHWSQDEFHGYGKVYNDNPIALEVQFDYTNFDMLDDYWIYYEGTLVSDTKQGRGKIKLTNGEVFEGDFHADRIQGFGKYYTIDGSFIEGIWRESKLIKVLNAS